MSIGFKLCHNNHPIAVFLHALDDTLIIFVTNINVKMILLNTKEKQTYVTPSIMVVEVKIEGVICTSPGEYPQWSPEDI